VLRQRTTPSRPFQKAGARLAGIRAHDAAVAEGPSETTGARRSRCGVLPRAIWQLSRTRRPHRLEAPYGLPARLDDAGALDVGRLGVAAFYPVQQLLGVVDAAAEFGGLTSALPDVARLRWDEGRPPDVASDGLAGLGDAGFFCDDASSHDALLLSALRLGRPGAETPALPAQRPSFGPRVPGLTLKSSGTNQLRPIIRAPDTRRSRHNCCIRWAVTPRRLAADDVSIILPTPITYLSTMGLSSSADERSGNYARQCIYWAVLSNLAIRAPGRSPSWIVEVGYWRERSSPKA